MSLSSSSSSAASSLFPSLPSAPTPLLLRRISAWRSRSLPTPLISRFYHPYYLMQLISFILYIPIRGYVWPQLIASSPSHISPFTDLFDPSTRECGMFLILLVLGVTKWRRACSTEMLVGQMIRYTRYAIIAATFIVDTTLCLFFGALYTALWMMGPHMPLYEGPTHVVSINARTFKNQVDNCEHSDPCMTYIVCFNHLSHEIGRWFLSEFARTSLKYGYEGSSVRFLSLELNSGVSVGVGVDTHDALEHETAHIFDTLQIDSTTTTSPDIPTLLMFQQGKVRARLPYSQKQQRKTIINMQNMNRAFNLDHIARIPKEALEEIQTNMAGTNKAEKKKK